MSCEGGVTYENEKLGRTYCLQTTDRTNCDNRSDLFRLVNDQYCAQYQAFAGDSCSTPGFGVIVDTMPAVCAKGSEIQQPSSTSAATDSTTSTAASVITGALSPSFEPPSATGAATPGNTQLTAPSPITSINNSSIATGTLVPTTNPLPTSSSNGGLSSGAIAGIVIGVIAILALIGGLAFFYLRRKKRHGRAHGDHYGGIAKVDEKRSDGSKSGLMASTIPLPAEDAAITGRMSVVRDDIKNHVQSFYHKMPVAPAALSSAGLQEFCVGADVDAPAFREMLLDPDTREVALRAYLSWTVFSRLGGQSDDYAALLPPSLAQLNRKISTPGFDTTEAIRRKTEGTHSSGRNAPRDVDLTGTIAAAESVLQPFASSESKRAANLDRVVQKAADFGLFLFSQPSLWKFDWSTTTGDAGRRGFVVTPALLQTVDERARVLRPSRVFFKAETS